MRDNMLKLNNNKIEVMIIGKKQQLSKLDDNITVHIGSLVISPLESVFNFGFIMNSNFVTICHINKLSSTIYLMLKNIAHIRHCIDTDLTKIFVQALTTSKIDYSKALLSGTPDYQIRKLQRLMSMVC